MKRSMGAVVLACLLACGSTPPPAPSEPQTATATATATDLTIDCTPDEAPFAFRFPPPPEDAMAAVADPAGTCAIGPEPSEDEQPPPWFALLTVRAGREPVDLPSTAATGETGLLGQRVPFYSERGESPLYGPGETTVLTNQSADATVVAIVFVRPDAASGTRAAVLEWLGRVRIVPHTPEEESGPP